MGGWSSTSHGWHRVRRKDASGVSYVTGRWTVPEIAVTALSFWVHWELGLAFIGLKLWHQASGANGSVFAFAANKWDALVNATRSLVSRGALPFSIHVGAGSSGNHAFDTWRRGELARIEAEREKLRMAEREFASYRDELLHAKDREDFDRFMQSRPRS